MHAVSGDWKPNEGVEKPNSEPGAQDLGSYFCSHILSFRGTC